MPSLTTKKKPRSALYPGWGLPGFHSDAAAHPWNPGLSGSEDSSTSTLGDEGPPDTLFRVSWLEGYYRSRSRKSRHPRGQTQTGRKRKVGGRDREGAQGPAGKGKTHPPVNINRHQNINNKTQCPHSHPVYPLATSPGDFTPGRGRLGEGGVQGSQTGYQRPKLGSSSTPGKRNQGSVWTGKGEKI